jgi:hypothetical protein
MFRLLGFFANYLNFVQQLQQQSHRKENDSGLVKMPFGEYLCGGMAFPCTCKTPKNLYVFIRITAIKEKVWEYKN